MADDRHFDSEHLLHFHADGEIVLAVLGDRSMDRGVAADLAHDAERRTLRRLAHRIGQLLLEDARRLAALVGDGVELCAVFDALVDVAGGDHLVKRFAQLEIAEAVVTPCNQIDHRLERNGEGEKIHCEQHKKLDVLLGMDKAVTDHNTGYLLWSCTHPHAAPTQENRARGAEKYTCRKFA